MLFFKMVEDAPVFRHAVRADDDGRLVHVVQLFAAGRRRACTRSGPSKGLRRTFFFQEGPHLLIPFLRVHAEHLGRAHSQRTVHIDGHESGYRRRSSIVQRVDNLLGATDGEGRNDHFAATRTVSRTTSRSCLARLVRGLMQPVAIGAFHDKDIG
jgi:hypothetical protein